MILLVYLNLFKLVSFGICVFMNTSHTHALTHSKYFFRNTNSMDATSFTKCVCVCTYGEGKHAKNKMMTVGTFNGKRNIHSSTETMAAAKATNVPMKAMFVHLPLFSLCSFLWYWLVCWFCNKIKWMCSVAKCKMICHSTSRENGSCWL